MEKNLKIGMVLTIAIIVIAVVLAPLLNTNGLFTQQKNDSITIGFIGILTGEGAAWGNAAKNGTIIAAEEINSNGGINGKKLEINYQDDEGDPKKALSALEYLTSNKINVIIGTTWSSTGLPLTKVADSKKTILISPSLGKPEFNESSKYIFNTWPHDVILSSQLADYVYSKGHKTVALIGAQEIWVKDQTNAFKKRFEELGGIVEVLVEPLPGQVDLSSDATKISSAKKSSAIVSTTDGILVGAKVAKRVRELGSTLPIYSITVDMDSVKASQGAYEEMELLTFLTPTQEFKEKYESRFGNIDIGADTAYDAVMLIAKAMKETNSTNTEKIQEYLNNLKTYSGASGEITFDGKGGVIKKSIIMKVQDKEIIQLK
ncbi:MAG: ABC transporter substrate-binding protein [archaeon]|jgi:branched-chain amino acid transport system substrate-binding protein